MNNTKKLSLIEVIITALSIIFFSLFTGLPILAYGFLFNEITDIYILPDFWANVICIGVMFLIYFIPTYIAKTYEYGVDCYKEINLQKQQSEQQIEQYKSELDAENQDIRVSLMKELDTRQNQLEQYREDLLEVENFQNNLWNEKLQSYPWLAKQYADYIYIFDKQLASNLRSKSHPAVKASDDVSRISSEKRELQNLCKLYEYQLNYYETIFPWLENFKELDPITAWNTTKSVDDNNENEYDLLKNWLSPQEYSWLSNQEKYQLALDRYSKRKKTNWDIGIEYERYIGYIYESKGYYVKFNGALSGLEDMGRDLLAYNSKETLVIQCKYWAKEKIIHEKHIFQLYGTTVLLRTEKPLSNIKPLFVTTTKLSETAKKCAQYLEMETIEDFPMTTYPLIKCNVSATDEKIYHLPFDQQYDRVFITKDKGDCYVATISDAESLGFRRAYRWEGFTK